MFRRSQGLYDAIYAWKDYRAEVDKLLSIILDRAPAARTLLDVACGTGKHLELLREHYEVEGVDVDPEMIAIAGERLGEGVPLHVADMTGLDLGRTFDVVTCLFSSIAYVQTDDGLRQAAASMARHTAPGGLVIIEPWFTPDAWEERHVTANVVDEPDLKIARMAASPPLTDPLTLTFHYLVATPNGVEHFTEDHVVGMFTHEAYVAALEGAGLAVEHDPKGLMGRGLYVGRRA